MTLHNALKALTLGRADNINEVNIVKELYSQCVTQIQFLLKALEFCQMTFGGNTGFLEVAHQRSGNIFLLCILETNLNGCIAIFLDGFDLRYHARTNFDNSAWHVLALGTENGCHSDFFS